MIRRDIKTRSLADGSELSISVFVFKGTDSNAPSVYIQSSVHAAEVQGYLVCLKLIEYFSKNPPKGDITIVPLANPYGLNCKMGEYTFGRFDPSTGDNWNRNYIDLSSITQEFLDKNNDIDFEKTIIDFKEQLKENIEKEMQKSNAYHKKLALELQHLAISEDIVLDLHCDTISVPHIYSASYLIYSVKAFNIPFVIEIPEKFAGALDEAIFCPWVSFTEKYNKLNHTNHKTPIEVFTIELGKQEDIDLKLAEKQSSDILNYLASKGVCDKDNIEKNSFYLCQLKDFVTIYAEMGGLIIDKVALGEELRAGESLMKINSPKLISCAKDADNLIDKSNINITYSKNAIPITRISTAVVHEGMALMKIFSNYKEL